MKQYGESIVERIYCIYKLLGLPIQFNRSRLVEESNSIESMKKSFDTKDGTRHFVDNTHMVRTTYLCNSHML